MRSATLSLTGDGRLSPETILSLPYTRWTGIGSVSSMVSPAFHRREISAYPRASGALKAVPFTFIFVIPSPFGAARYSVLTSRFGARLRTARAFGAFGFTVSFTAPSHG